MIISYDTPPDGSGNYPFGTVATFSCVSGFGLSGSGAVSSLCGGDGSSSVGVFDAVTPTCECMWGHKFRYSIYTSPQMDKYRIFLNRSQGFYLATHSFRPGLLFETGLLIENYFTWAFIY